MGTGRSIVRADVVSTRLGLNGWQVAIEMSVDAALAGADSNSARCLFNIGRVETTVP